MDELKQATAGVGYRAKLTQYSTPQNVYDEIKAALAAGNFPAIDENRICRYRTPEGKACVAGIFIPNKCYLPSMEHCSLNDIFLDIEHPDFLLKKNGNYGESLLRGLQSAHDSFKWDDYPNGTITRDKHFLEDIRGTFLKHGHIVE